MSFSWAIPFEWTIVTVALLIGGVCAWLYVRHLDEHYTALGSDPNESPPFANSSDQAGREGNAATRG